MSDRIFAEHAWSTVGTLRLWSSDGGRLGELRGHEDLVNGALALADGRVLKAVISP